MKVKMINAFIINGACVCKETRAEGRDNNVKRAITRYWAAFFSQIFF